MALDFVAGCIGGCAGVLVGHPFDTVKVRLQTQCTLKPMYKGTFHCFISIIKNESMSGLYKGMSSPMAGLAAINAIVFGVYGNILRSLPNPNSLCSQFVAGVSTGVVQSLVCSPMELAKIQMQIQGQGQPKHYFPFWKRPQPFYNSPLDCLFKIYRLDGMRGLFRGLCATALRDAPAFGVYFAGYEYLTQIFTDSNGDVNTIGLIMAGGLAGVLSWVVVYPVDVLKSRLQADGIGNQRLYNGLCDCMKKSLISEGYKVMFRGLNSTVVRAFPTNAATFCAVTWVLMLFEADKKSIRLRMEKHTNMLME